MKPQEKVKSRQLRQQHDNIARGMCRTHKNRPIAESSSRCKQCLAKERQRVGVKKPHPGKHRWITVDPAMSDKRISVIMGVTVDAVQLRRKRGNIPFNQPPK